MELAGDRDSIGCYRQFLSKIVFCRYDAKEDANIS
jgi:hypothetical protein